MRWKFDRAWPCKFTGPTMHAGNNEIAMETVVICTESNVIDT
jgi:phage tail-like protein